MLFFKPPTAYRSNGLAVLAAFVLAGLAPAVEAADDPAALSGTWSFTGSHSGGTSPNCPGTVAFQWILAMQPDGSTVVTVQGETVYPKLTGYVHGDATSFSGVLDALHSDAVFTTMNDRAHIELKGSGTTFLATETTTFFDKATDGSAYPTTCTFDAKGHKL